MSNFNEPRPSRRNILLLSTAAVLLGTPSFAISTSSADAFVIKAIAEIEKLVNTGKSGNALYADVSRFFKRYCDVRSIARAVIGAPWRGMSSAKRKEYTSAFEKYVVRKYGSRLQKLRGGKGQIVRTRDQGASGVLIDVNFVWAGSNPRKVQFLISDGGGAPKVLDLKIIGISLLSAERIFVRQALTHSNNNIDKLIAKLNK